MRRSSPHWRPAKRQIESRQIDLEKTQLISRTVPLHDRAVAAIILAENAEMVQVFIVPIEEI